MSPLKIYTASGSSLSFAHRVLWDAVLTQLEVARERPEASWSCHLAAALLAAASFEAYLNYVGEELLPHIWADERANFSKAKYKGVMGKLKRIAEEIQWELPGKNMPPYLGVVELQALREKIVHARPARSEYKVQFKEGNAPRLPGRWLERELPIHRAERLIKSANDLAVALHEALEKSDASGLIFGAHPFVGAIGVGGYHVGD